jgi:UDP-glucuronate 4-epimerase
VPKNVTDRPRVLVTGAAGFLGFHLARRLLETGFSALGIDNLNAYYDVGLKKARLRQLDGIDAFQFVRLDLTDHEGISSLFDRFRPDYVVHLAAQAGVRHSISHPHAYVASNLDGHLSILEACRRFPVRHLIYASSSSVYGANKKVPFHEDDPVREPVSLYAATKRADELMSHSYAHLYGIPCSGIRFFTVYGPWGRPDMAYYLFTQAIMEGRPIKLFNNGRMQRDFTYVDDVTTAMEKLLDHPPSENGPEGEQQAPHTLYNVGNHTPIELLRFVAAIEAAVGKEAEKEYLPMQPGDVPVTFADVERLSKVTGFAPKTSIEEGIARFVDWYKEYRAKPGAGE